MFFKPFFTQEACSIWRRLMEIDIAGESPEMSLAMVERLERSFSWLEARAPKKEGAAEVHYGLEELKREIARAKAFYVRELTLATAPPVEAREQSVPHTDALSRDVAASMETSTPPTGESLLPEDDNKSEERETPELPTE